MQVTSISVDIVDNVATGLLQTPTKGQSEVYELSTCPVCLERMDSAVTGLVTVPCSHTFHCQCLSKWGDSRYCSALYVWNGAANIDVADIRKELQEVQDQMRDVLFYLEARDKIEQGGGAGTIGEAAGGSLSIATPQVPPEVPHAPSSRKRPKKKKTQ